MAEKKSLVEETLLQMRSLENVISENAKGILHSTMKEEIGELVKESLKETEDDELEEMDEQETDIETDDDTETDDMTDMEDDEDEDEMDSDEEDMDSDMDMTDMDDEEPIDLTGASDEEILKVFKGMGEDDGIIVKKEGNTVDLQDTNDNSHYKISLGEQYEEDEDEDFSFDTMGMSDDDEEEEGGWEEITSKPHSKSHHHSFDEQEEEEEEGVVYEIEMDEEDEESMDMDEQEEDEEVVYEIEMDEEDEESMDMEEQEEEEKIEEGFKAKGTGMGNPKKFKYKTKPNQDLPTKKMKQGTKGVGMGKAKFEYKEGKKMTMKPVKKGGETAESSRTLGAGKRWGRNGLNKPRTAPRQLKVESVNTEIKLLREKNEEYRKALNVFRTKLNEVAVFNSNLAYATRLFTEHSTTKQEKINILRRFDSVESLKESKSLYKTVKEELSSQSTTAIVKESIQEKIERAPQSGSAASLIESKTYENPQFMRMKDLMSKMNIIK